MDPISQQATTLIREGEPSKPRPDNEVKPNSADAVTTSDAPSKTNDASKSRDKKRKGTKKQSKGSKAKKDKKKNKKRPQIDDSSDLSSSSDDDSTELDSDSEDTDDEVVVRRRRTNKKGQESLKPKTVGTSKKHKALAKSKLKPPATSASDSDSDSSGTGWESSSSEVEDAEPLADQKKSKDHGLNQDVGFQVARELQRILQLAQTHAPPPPPGLSSHAGLGATLDPGLGSGLLPNSGTTFPRSNAFGGLQAMASGRARPAYEDRLGLFDGLDDPLGRDVGLSNRRNRRGASQGDRKLPGGGAEPQKQKSKKYDFKRVDQVWDNSIHNFKLQDTAESAADKKYDGFCFHVRRTFDWEGKYKATVVDVKSKALRECLQDVIGNIKGVSLVDETPKLDPNVLFLYLEDLRKHARQLKKQVKKPSASDKQERKKEVKWLEEKRLHLKVLVKYIDKDYEHIKNSLHPMLEHGLITFDLLWALWKPGTLAYTTTYGSHDEPRVFKVDTAEKHFHMSKGEFYYVDGKYFEYDGKQFGYGRMMEEIGEFRGAKKITSLSSYPLKYHKNEEQIRKDLIERGKKFAALSGVHYKSHQGMAYYKKKKSIIKVNVNGRVMIDPAIHRRINPNYPISLVRPKEQDILTEDEESDDEEGCCIAGSDSEDDGAQERDFEEGEEKVRYVTKVIKDNKGRMSIVRMTKDEAEEMNKEKLSKVETQDDAIIDGSSDEGKPQGSKKTPEWTDEEYLIASPVVLGFSFGEKLWLEFTVSGVQDIRWNEHAYESLVLEKRTKETVKALVESHKYHAAESIDDVIQGKGKGLVSVLHGPPGTGKTLTAEGISELLKCPLYMVSAGELGTDSRVLEGELQRILDICHAWGAILLLDEADVFLEKRNMHDIHRNALVSIFLRQLEYFQGILFLTTNRVETFDDAFQSRIHIALRYDPLDLKAKKAIFKMFVEKARSQQKSDSAPFTEEEYNTLARHDLNGRQIKNTVIRAQALAVNKGEPLSMVHVRQILDVQVNFDRDLKGGTGYQDAMRSYF
ncbi:hypothetical protein N8I77_001079 [Diaporthe amygdali]|uniref:AAA+ ATPase domain-containing protein n=1 Tax=Phomopsis amygdali TaxID=1214568 RepID=A0AAD9SQV8_PHOAM|nr:hypothetical protein N8I77_001079 [Diaporthe amygdali]